jgi:hypothetical protein
MKPIASRTGGRNLPSHMRRKITWLTLIGMASLAGAGCSGFSASPSVSPATFLLPGIMKNDPPPASVPAPTVTEKQVALAR